MRFLVMSGGSCRGAFQTGCLKYLLNDLELQYDGVCGISIGAINSAVLAQHRKDQPKEAFLELENQWNNISQEKVIKPWWPFGKLSSVWKQSLFDSTPLTTWLEKDVDLKRIRASGRMIGVGAVSLVTNKYRMFTEKDDDLIKGVIASSSYPGFFIPVKIGDDIFSDGGLKKQVNLSDAINLGADEIDMLVCNPPAEGSNDPKLGNTIDVLGRTLSTLSNELMEYNINTCIFYNKLVTAGLSEGKRYIKLNVLRPETSLISDSMDFSHESYKRMFNIGYDLARKNFKP